MPPRNNELPEGTDHIVNGAMATGAGSSAGAGASTGSSGGMATGGGASTGATATGAATGSSGGGASSGFIGGTGDDTGGTTAGELTTGSSGGGARQQLRDGAASLKQQAADKARSYAEDGKTRATDALDEFSRVVQEAAATVDERLGAEYGDYARRAADAVSGFASSLRDKDVDDLYDGARELVRKSPVVAIGTAAAIGFALVRLIKSGIPDEERDVEFTPDANLGAGNQPQAPSVGSTAGTGA